MTTGKARKLRGSPTEAERLLWTQLRYRQMNGHKFRRQHDIGQYIVDFACVEQRLVIELDGGHHNQVEQAEDDAVRTARLESQGYRVLRFWNHQVMHNVEAVKAVILNALGDPHPFGKLRAGSGPPSD